ncbi:ABC transporter permease [Mesorhizobium sp. M1A.F.Ca.ET.072.01.1.1]|uniref:ABC transporter permease n=1 Tax=Mesorhizobium sp. M1A.F.Ca.ET.072.01.1.1 TaxID=2496753 RepID=UPI000FD338AC|nr:ABC transporter permease [Mesorhizobium sp. M1A.F.Ca.ET.072.01.1.1]RUW46869.1 ABC transporter permease [Mesorhizobium sp. M1A.F.Ca.ET.072.01.1.1]TIU97446.1 MAG: ABC transporter permease subunit [Mesorhizobium sp.]
MTKAWKLYDPRLAWILVAPTLMLLLVFLVLPIAVMAIYTFFTFVTAGLETSTLTTANWHEFLTDSYYYGFLLKTLRIGAIIALLCGILGYFPAYFIWATTFKHKWLLLLLLIVPFWISFTIRTYSWINILGEQGVINVALLKLGIISEPLPMLYNEGAVIVGLLHFLLPYMILNVYVSLESIDRTLIAAARSMGCTSAQAFREVTLPLSLPGLAAGLMLCFVLAAGSYVTPQLLGSGRDALFGNLISDTIMSELNWPMGATLSIVLFVVLGFFAAIYTRYMGMSQVVKGLGG